MRNQLLRVLSPLRFGQDAGQAFRSVFSSHGPCADLFPSSDEKQSKSANGRSIPLLNNLQQQHCAEQMSFRSLHTSSMAGVPPPGTNLEVQDEAHSKSLTVQTLVHAAEKNPSLMLGKSKSFRKFQQNIAAATYATATAAHGEEHHIHDLRVNNFPFHVLPYSPWPIMAAGSVMAAVFGGVMWFHQYPGGGYVMATGLTNIALTATTWWRDIVIESHMGMHNDVVRSLLTQGMYWFILSEAMLFFGLLWACVHVGMAPTVGVHMQWPPVGIHGLEWDKRALVMSAVLAASYFSANLALYSKAMLWLTIGMGGLFLASQYIEYSTAPFTITDSAYGSSFYLTTGFHGMHVFLGSIYLAVCAMFKPTTYGPSIGLRNAILYWHFVDIVWIGVYGIIYVGGY